MEKIIETVVSNNVIENGAHQEIEYYILNIVTEKNKVQKSIYVPFTISLN